MGTIGLVFWSGTGNTEAMADKIEEGIVAAGVTVDKTNVGDFSGSVGDYEKLVLGCPSMGDEVLEEDEFEPFFESIEGDLSGKKVALFGSFGWGDGQWMRDWEERVKNAGADLYKDGLTVNETPDDDGEAECVEFGKEFAAY